MKEQCKIHNQIKLQKCTPINMNYKYKFLYKKSTMFYIFFLIIFIFQIICEKRNLQTTGSELTIKINGVGI